jgi:2-oxoglutarate ferredoxin oxidoreductase subunit beta
MSTETTPKTESDGKPSLRSDLKPIWCPGCGDYAVTAGLEQALSELGFESHEVVFVSGIGCSSRLPYFFRTYGFHTIHGRAAAVAVGVKMANPDLHVIVVGGDGDFFSIGTNHFIHAARRNINLTVVCMDNHIYGLTKGQVSPTSAREFVTKTSPFGSVEAPINPLVLALSCGATFVAQSYSGKIKHMRETLIAAQQHEGFSFVNIRSPCVTFNQVDTFKAYKTKVAFTEEEAKGTLAEAMQFLLGGPADQVPLGTFYQAKLPTFDGGWREMAKRTTGKFGTPTMEEILDGFA